MITTASPRNFEYVTSLGASCVFDCNSPSVVRGEAGVGHATMGHHSGAPERHRVGGGQVRREGEELLDRGDRLLDVAAAQAGERLHALTDP